MPNIGMWEIVIVVVIALLVFGPKRLPELGSSLGRSITGFKKSLRETTDEVQAAVSEDVSSEATPTSAAAGAPPASAATATGAAAMAKSEQTEES